jgi:hypothetical protein
VILPGIFIVSFFITPGVALLLQAWFLTGNWARFHPGVYLIAWVLGLFLEMIGIGLFMEEPGLLLGLVSIAGTFTMGALWWAGSRSENADRERADGTSGADR